jgi:hypothetical protein
MKNKTVGRVAFSSRSAARWTLPPMTRQRQVRLRSPECLGRWLEILFQYRIRVVQARWYPKIEAANFVLKQGEVGIAI